MESSSGKYAFWDQLEKGEDGLRYFEGAVFTGICIKNYHNPLDGSGSKEWEISFINGQKDGPARNFDAQGNLVRVEYYKEGTMTKVKNYTD